MSKILRGLTEAKITNYGPGDSETWPAYSGHPNDPRDPPRRGRQETDDYDREPYNPMDDYYKKQDAAQAKYNKEVKVEYSDKEGVAPNGERYNSMFVVRASNPYQGDNEIRKFEDLHWGAKKIVDTGKKETKDVNQSFLTVVYYVDNHKYGTWRPWKDEAPTQKPLTFENPVEHFGKMLEGISQEDLANVLCRRIEMRYPDIYKKYDYDAMYNAVDDVASFHAGAEELGSSDINIMIREVFKHLESTQGVAEATGAVTFAGKDPNEFQSPKGGKPVMVVVTDQGSRYLITSDGMVLRHKSVHANTGGEDSGLQAWSDKIEFYDRSKPLVSGGMQNMAFPDAVTYLFDKGRIALSKGQNGERVALIAANGAWRPATIADAMPKAVQAKPEWGKIIIKADAGTWGTQPKLGWQPLDYNQRSDGTLNRVHNGSPVSHGAKVQQGVAEGSLEEVSKKMLGRYVSKARDDLSTAINHSYRDYEDDEADEKDNNRAEKRQSGIDLARAKINKSGKSGKTTAKVKATEGVAEGQGEQMSKTKALNELRKELMNSYEYMKCGNLQEFQQRLQWLSEGMLKNHMTGKSHVINQEEIELYQEYREKREQIQRGLTSKGVAEGDEQVYKVLAVDKSNALSKETMLKVKAGSIDEVFERLAMSDWYPLKINGEEVIKGKSLAQGVAEDQLDELKCWTGYKRVPGTKTGAPGSCEEIKEEDLNEYSTDRLAKYKTAIAADARAADKAGDFARGNKRFAGIVKATKKQFDNETKPKKENAIMKGLVDENLGTPYPGTYEQEYGPFKRKGQERTMKIAFEGKKNVSRRT